MLSTMGNRIKRFYDAKPQLWTKQQVHDAATVKVITEDEYYIITGEVYIPTT